ncbi:unnamed protein product [Penicillium manginii]
MASTSIKMALLFSRQPLIPLWNLTTCFGGASAPHRRSLATSAQSIGWQKIGPHKYIRSLDAIERSLKYAYEDLAPPGIRTQDVLTTAHISLDRGLTLEPVVFETLMRRAWARVGLLHPAVAATFCGDGFEYSVPRDEGEIQTWVAKSFIVKDTQFQTSDARNPPSSPSVLFQDLATVPPESHPIMYYFRHDKTFVLRTPHIYTDGTGTLILLNDFLTELSSLLEGDHAATANIELRLSETDIVKKLPLSSIAVASIPTVSSAQLQALLPDIDLNLTQNREAIQFPIHNLKTSSTDPGAGRLRAFKLNADETAAIIRSGKRTGLGFTALVHAAILHAGQGLSPGAPVPNDINTHTTLTGFKFRDRCSLDSPNAGERAFISRVSLWPFKVQLSNDIWETARCLKAQYTTLAEQKDLIIPASVRFMQECLPKFADNLDASFFASFPGDLTTIVRQRYGRINVQGLGLNLITTTPMIILVVQSFGGEMEISLTYSPASHEDEKVGC